MAGPLNFFFGGGGVLLGFHGNPVSHGPDRTGVPSFLPSFFCVLPRTVDLDDRVMSCHTFHRYGSLYFTHVFFSIFFPGISKVRPFF